MNTDKMILVIDKSVNCDECDICYPRVAEDGERMEFCPMTGWMKIETAKEGIQPNCPLKKLPQTRPCNYYDFEHYTSGYDKGWNDCVDYLSEEGRWKNKNEQA